MKSMAVLTLIFAFSIAYATFVENDYGTHAAKALVYNSRWFEVLLVFLGLNLLGNIFIYKLYTSKKVPQFLFHLAFLIILIGSGITRYYGYEGVMHIREGGVSNKMVSSDIYFTIRHNGKSFSKKLLLSP